MPRRKAQAPKAPAGLKHLQKALPLLASVHDAGCGRDVAGNRTLHFDQLIALILLYLFDPAIESMRAVCRSTGLKKVQKRIGSVAVSKSSFSEAARVFDAGLLLPVIGELYRRLGTVGRDKRLSDADLKYVLTFVDGTLLRALPRITAAMWLRTRDGKPHYAFRLHAQFEFDKHVPARFDLTDAVNSGKSDEKNVLRQNLQKDRCYVMDRWFAQFRLFNEIHAIASGYVCRIREPGEMRVIAERPLTQADREAGVISDQVVRLGTSMSRARQLDHHCRLLILEVSPHEKRGGAKGKRSGPPNEGKLYLASDLLDVPAEIIALIYHYRWTIELFFRFFKHVLGCRHLLFDCPNGVAIQVYTAMIACMLLSLWTGAKPTRPTMEMFRWHFAGMASDAELETYLRRLKKIDA
jgi:Transposase DDE domain